jgi:hypothetical protein
MERLKKMALCMGVTLAVFVLANPMVNAAPKFKCQMDAGPGGLTSFPWTKSDKAAVIRLPLGEVRSVFIHEECGGDLPVVTIQSGSGIKPMVRWDVEWFGDIAVRGHWVTFSTFSIKDLNNSAGYAVKIVTSKKIFQVHIQVIAGSTMAEKAYQNSQSLREHSDQLRLHARRIVQNEQRANDAHRIARNAKARSMADVELSLYGFFAGETPGHPGGGMGISSNIILGKFAKDVVQLGLSPHVSFMRYQLQIEGLPPDGALNRDMNSTEWDFGLSFLLRVQPFKYLYLDGKLGFSLRVVDNSDAMTWQEDYPTYQIYGINGRSAKMAVLNWGIGIYFPVARNFAFGVSYMGTVSLNKQACVLSATTDHNMCNSFNHSGAVEIRARF